VLEKLSYRCFDSFNHGFLSQTGAREVSSPHLSKSGHRFSVLLAAVWFVRLVTVNIPNPSLDVEDNNACALNRRSGQKQDDLSDASARPIELDDYCLTSVTNCICGMH
jgi:hypothetical protein